MGRSNLVITFCLLGAETEAIDLFSFLLLLLPSVPGFLPTVSLPCFTGTLLVLLPLDAAELVVVHDVRLLTRPLRDVGERDPHAHLVGYVVVGGLVGALAVDVVVALGEDR